MSAKHLVTIDDDEMGIDYADAGPWRSYCLTTFGDTLVQCLANASVTEIDQDGRDLNGYPLSSRGGEVADVAERMIRAALAEAGVA